MAAFVYRGPNTFHFAKKRHKLDSLRSRMAEHRTCNPGGGGGWDSGTGDGVAWHKNSDRFGPWGRVREFRAGQWIGPWRHQKYEL